MKKAFVFISFILIFSCQGNAPVEFIMLSEGLDENPESRRKAIAIFNNGKTFFCIEQAEKAKYEYYEYNIPDSIWVKYKQIVNTSFIKKNPDRYDHVSDSPNTELVFKLNGGTKRIDDLSYLILNQETQSKIYTLFNLVDTKKAKKINYFPFKSPVLFEELPNPPPIK
jgi:hypothetical protein